MWYDGFLTSPNKNVDIEQVDLTFQLGTEEGLKATLLQADLVYFSICEAI